MPSENISSDPELCNAIEALLAERKVGVGVGIMSLLHVVAVQATITETQSWTAETLQLMLADFKEKGLEALGIEIMEGPKFDA